LKQSIVQPLKNLDIHSYTRRAPWINATIRARAFEPHAVGFLELDAKTIATPATFSSYCNGIFSGCLRIND
jgi:hypothetical protein